MKSRQPYFEQSEVWDHEPQPYQDQVRTDILSMIPGDVVSVLDAGCGDGFITNALPPDVEVVGLDLSGEALRRVQRHKVQGSIMDLPFGDRAFDLVMANDVVEHLHSGEFQRSLQELQRVAAKYMLITVPLNEQLQAMEARCQQCGTTYHVNRHQRSFAEWTVSKVAGGHLQRVEIRLSGDLTVACGDLTVILRQRLGHYNLWPQAVCPDCGSKSQVSGENNDLLLGTLDERRARQRACQLIESGPWNNRSELITLFASQRWVRSLPAVPAESRSASPNSVDFSNALQAVSEDFVPGTIWARFRPGPGCQITSKGVCRTDQAPETVRILIQLPLPVGGDSFELVASGDSRHDKARLYLVDGLTGREIPLIDTVVGQQNQSVTAVIPEECWPDRFGWKLELYLAGRVCVRSLRHLSCPAGTAALPFFEVKQGHTVFHQQIDGVDCSWGLWAEKPGHYPLPDLEQLFSQHQPRSSDCDFVDLFAPLREASSKLRQEIALLKQDLQKKEAQRQQAEAMNSRLQQEYDTLECQSEVERSEAEKACADVEKRMAEEESRRSQAEAASADVERRMAEVNSRLGSVSAELVATKAHLRSLRGIRGGSRELARSLKRRVLGATLPVPQETYLAPWKTLDRAPQLRNEQLRVLVLSHMFPHPDQPMLGSFVAEQVAALRDLGSIDARVLSGRPYWMNQNRAPLTLWSLNRNYYKFHDSCRWVEYGGVPVKFVPYRILTSRWSHGCTYRQSLLRGIEEIQKDFPFQIVHAHTAYLDGTAGLAIARKFGVPLIITEHTGPFSNLLSSRITRSLVTRSLRGASRVIAVSSALQRDISPVMEPGDTGKMLVVPNGTDLRAFHLSGKWDPDPDHPRLVFVGAFVESKNLALLLEAFSRVARQIPGATLRLIGGAQSLEEEGQLTDHIARLELQDKISLQGHTVREEVARILREECDLLVLPSKIETFGCVLTEAMACGKPVVVTRCGGPEDIITADFLGQLCENENADGLTQALLEVIQNLRQYDSARIRRHVEQHFDYQTVAARLDNLYVEVLGEAHLDQQNGEA